MARERTWSSNTVEKILLEAMKRRDYTKNFIFHKNYFKNFFRMKIVPVQFANKLLL